MTFRNKLFEGGTQLFNYRRLQCALYLQNIVTKIQVLFFTSFSIFSKTMFLVPSRTNHIFTWQTASIEGANSGPAGSFRKRVPLFDSNYAALSPLPYVLIIHKLGVFQKLLDCTVVVHPMTYSPCEA